MTVTGTVDDRTGLNVDVAVMLTVPAATPVTTPAGLTVAMAGSDVDQFTVVLAPPTAVTVAVSVTVAEASIVALVGVMVTPFTAGRKPTEIVADARLVVSMSDVAVTTVEPMARARTRPLFEVVATAVSDDDHETTVSAPPTVDTEATYCICSPITSVLDIVTIETASTFGITGGVGSVTPSPSRSRPPLAVPQPASATPMASPMASRTRGAVSARSAWADPR